MRVLLETPTCEFRSPVIICEVSTKIKASMNSTILPRVKVCCIASIAEAWLAIEHGASAIGLVSAMPSGPGPIPEPLIAEIANVVPPGVASFLLTCKQDVASIVEQQRRLGVNTIQICDRLEDGTYDELHVALPGVSIVQVIHVTGPESVSEAKSVAPHVDAILLDSEINLWRLRNWAAPEELTTGV